VLLVQPLTLTSWSSAHEARAASSNCWSDRSPSSAAATLARRRCGQASEAAGHLDQVLYATVRRWLAERWPFTRVAWPGRELPWEEYDALPDQ
jgi:hypothetical protein